MSRMYAMLFPDHRAPFYVDIVADGVQAIALIELQAYDLVITDLNMPILDGRGLYLRVQDVCKQKSRKMPRFLFCSAVSSALDQVAEFCIDSTNRRMLKPFSMPQLQDIMREMTEND